MEKVACYCRVSTKTAEQIESITNQKEFFQTFAIKNNLEIYEIYSDEGISAKQMKNRPNFLRMMEDAKQKKFDTVLVKDISRFSRNTVDILTSIRELSNLGINVKFITWNFETLGRDSEFMLTITGAMAQEESKRLSSRVKFGKRLNAEKGRVPNFVFGYDKIDTFNLKINDSESDVVKLMFDMFVNQKFGTAKIAGILNSKGILTKKTKKTNWTQKTVLDIIRNQIYIGKIVNRKSEVSDFLTGKRKKLDESDRIVVENSNLIIIDPSIFYEAQKILDERKDCFKLDKSRESIKYLFSNMIKCQNCGFSMRRCKRKYSEFGNEYIWWTCSYRNAYGTNSCLNSTKVRESELINLIQEFLKSLLENKRTCIDIITKEVNKIIKSSMQPSAKTEIELRKEIEHTSDKILRNAELESEGLISREQLKKLNPPLVSKLNELEKELSMMQNYKPGNLDIRKAVNEFFDEVFNLNNINLTNESIKKIFSKIIISKDGDVELIIKIGSSNGKTLELSGNSLT